MVTNHRCSVSLLINKTRDTFQNVRIGFFSKDCHIFANDCQFLAKQVGVSFRNIPMSVVMLTVQMCLMVQL